nr:MAG TPA: hypothetical protein [Caudoviricetes sp.]
MTAKSNLHNTQIWVLSLKNAFIQSIHKLNRFI